MCERFKAMNIQSSVEGIMLELSRGLPIWETSDSRGIEGILCCGGQVISNCLLQRPNQPAQTLAPGSTLLNSLQQ